MKGGGGDCVTWDDFVHRAFVRPLKRFLEACDTVVLAFDNYAQVGSIQHPVPLAQRQGLRALGAARCLQEAEEGTPAL